MPISPFCCAEVVTNSLEKVIISYLVHEISKQTETDIMVKNNIEKDEKSAVRTDIRTDNVS